MTIRVYIYKDGSVAVTHNGNSYNKYEEFSRGDTKILDIEEPLEY